MLLYQAVPYGVVHRRADFVLVSVAQRLLSSHRSLFSRRPHTRCPLLLLLSSFLPLSLSPPSAPTNKHTHKSEYLFPNKSTFNCSSELFFSAPLAVLLVIVCSVLVCFLYNVNRIHGVGPSSSLHFLCSSSFSFFSCFVPSLDFSPPLSAFAQALVCFCLNQHIWIHHAISS